jgi:hypothetical protein
MFALMTRALKNVARSSPNRAHRARRFADPGKGSPASRAKPEHRADLALRGIIVPGGPGARKNLDSVYPFLAEAAVRRVRSLFSSADRVHAHIYFSSLVVQDLGTIGRSAELALLEQVIEREEVMLRQRPHELATYDALGIAHRQSRWPDAGQEVATRAVLARCAASV